MSEAPKLVESPEPEPVSRRAHPSKRLILLVVLPLIAILALGAVYLRGGRYVGTDNAYVQADMAPVSAEVSGTVKVVLVRENQTIAAGEVLFRLDPAPFRVAVERAEANQAQVRTNLLALKASYREKQAEIALARTRHDFAVRNERRQEDLAAKSYVAATALDDSRLNADVTAQQVTESEQGLRQIAESLGGGVEDAVEAHPSYRVAVADLDQARLDLARVEVRAPVSGIASAPPKPGQYLAAGSTAMLLVENSRPRVEANLVEKDLTFVHPGEFVEVRIDTYPHVTWKGVVESLSPATGSEFSIIPAQNATGNWVKVAQRVAVRIRLEPGPNQPPLRSGLSANVRIDTGHRRHLPGFAG